MAVVSKRYAEALINTAVESNAVVKYEEQLDTLLMITSNDELKDVLEYPGINSDKKKELIKAVAGNKLDKEVINFFMLLIDNGRQKHFQEIVGEYKKLSDLYKNVVFAEITSAEELDNKEIEEIKSKVKTKYKSENVRIKTIVDPKVLGGVKLKVGDTIIDGTIQARLDKMNSLIKKS